MEEQKINVLVDWWSPYLTFTSHFIHDQQCNKRKNAGIPEIPAIPKVLGVWKLNDNIIEWIDLNCKKQYYLIEKQGIPY